MSKVSREKFTTTLDPNVVTRLGIIKAINKNKGLNEVIEELVNKKYKEMGFDDTNNKERQASK
jgi:hypothetical protein